MSSAKARRIRLTPLQDVNPSVQMALLNVRNEGSVRQAMFTDHVISDDEHRRWIRALESDPARLVWIMLDDAGEAIGQVSLHRLDRRQKSADWAFYLTRSERGGLGFAVEFAFLDFVFGTMDMFKLNCEVVEDNDAVLRLHDRFGFKSEGFRRSQIIKDGRRIGVHLLGLTKDDWALARRQVVEKNAPVLERFEITIQEATARSPVAVP